MFVCHELCSCFLPGKKVWSGRSPWLRVLISCRWSPYLPSHLQWPTHSPPERSSLPFSFFRRCCAAKSCNPCRLCDRRACTETRNISFLSSAQKTIQPKCGIVTTASARPKPPQPSSRSLDPVSVPEELLDAVLLVKLDQADAQRGSVPRDGGTTSGLSISPPQINRRRRRCRPTMNGFRSTLLRWDIDIISRLFHRQVRSGRTSHKGCAITRR